LPSCPGPPVIDLVAHQTNLSSLSVSFALQVCEIHEVLGIESKGSLQNLLKFSQNLLEKVQRYHPHYCPRKGPSSSDLTDQDCVTDAMEDVNENVKLWSVLQK
jgi:hypothetical protein